MSFLQGQSAHPAETIVEILERDAYGSPVMWVGADNRIYGYDERGGLADYTEWYTSQVNNAGGARGFGGNYNNNAYQYDDRNYGRGFGRSGYEPSPGISPRGFSGRIANEFGYDDAATFNGNRPAMGGSRGSSLLGGNNAKTRSTVSDIPVTKATNSIGRSKRDIVMDDLKPIEGSEMLPLYDENTEALDVNVDYNNKLFKIEIIKKG